MAIVQCPLCHTTLQEPPGAPYFTCVCGTLLQSSSAHLAPAPPPNFPGPPPPLGPQSPPHTNGDYHAPPPGQQRPLSSGSRPVSSEPPDMSNLSLHERRPSSASSNLPYQQFAAPPPQPQYHQCATCGGFLNLPDNLPRDKKGNRLVRCGSCQSVNRFPDPEPEIVPPPVSGPTPPPAKEEFVPPPAKKELVPPPAKEERVPPSMKEDSVVPPPKQESESPARRPFAYEQQGSGVGSVESSASPTYSGEMKGYGPPPPAYAPPPPTYTPSPPPHSPPPPAHSSPPPAFNCLPAAYTGPPLQPDNTLPGPPPPFPDYRMGPPGYPVPPPSGGTLPPHSLAPQISMPAHQAPHGHMQPQYSLPPAYHDGRMQPGAYPGEVGPPGVGAPPPVAPPRVGAKRRSSLFGKLKGAFKEEDEFERDVKINGFPVPDAQVKKAEPRSGPLQPGDYWYDVRAGFWGIMDGPCLGIIPAGIYELVRNKKSEAEGGPGMNELQRHFSGGTSGVIINGRELTPRDLTVLKGRGLSDEPRAYWLDINGQLTDAMTNQPLIQLGHLAASLAQGLPGLGMRIPEEELRRRKLEEVKKALQEAEAQKPIVAKVN